MATWISLETSFAAPCKFAPKTPGFFGPHSPPNLGLLISSILLALNVYPLLAVNMHFAEMEFEEHEVTEDVTGDGVGEEEQIETAVKKKVKRKREEQPIIKNQIRDKAAKNTEENSKDERRITNISQIKSKIRRNEEWLKLKREKKKEKRARQDERKKEAEAAEERGEEAPEKLVPKTIDSMREYDETTVGGKEGTEEDEEVEHDVANDEFSSYFAKTYEPKVLITCSDNPHSKTIAFMKELTRIIPNSEPKWRKNASVKKIVQQSTLKGFTDILVVNEDNRSPNGLIVSHLPDGPTAHFKLSNVKVTTDLKKDHRAISAHRPEVILNNFSTRLGHGVARMLASLFHYEPQFVGKRVVTFHNQRDYIFFRHHKYDFKSTEKCRLRDLGPRFTLKLRSLQKGTFDSKFGDFEWIISNHRHEMETSRRKFFL